MTYNSQDFTVYWAEEGAFNKNPSISVGSLTVDTDVGADTITLQAGATSWITEGFGVGQSIDVAGTVDNDGTYTITAITATVITIGGGISGTNNVGDSGVTINTNVTWIPFLEVNSISGRGTTEEILQQKRLGTRQRAGSPRGAIEEDTMSIEMGLTTNTQVSSIDADVFDGFLLKSTENFDHTYNKATNTALLAPPSYTILVKETDGAVYEYYTGCILNEVEFGITAKEVVKVTFNFERAGSDLTTTEATGDDTYGTYPSVTYVMWSDVTVTKQNNEADDDWTTAAAIINMETLNFTVSQGAQKKFRISGARQAASIDLVGFGVEGSLDFDYDDLNEYTEIASDNRGDLSVAFGASVGSLIIEDVTYEGFPMDASPDELLTASVDFSADTIAYAT
jgi:hypothetical protein